MLKAQLHSKYFVADHDWRQAEDVLTGDFFGVLDYLPRESFLTDFLRRLHAYDDRSPTLELARVNWETIEFDFWPMTYADDENAEPDLLIVSNRWFLVVEVKLDSGLGKRQPWREYVVGRQLARERGLPPECVRYIVVARGRPDVSATFATGDMQQRDELLPRAYCIRWCDIVTMVESWLRHGLRGQPLIPEQTRMLEDLLQGIRKRRNIAFEGFAFANQNDVAPPMGRLFCPSFFEGFLARNTPAVSKLDSHAFLAAFDGFLNRGNGSVNVGRTWPVSTFWGFLQGAKRCRSQRTLIF